VTKAAKVIDNLVAKVRELAAARPDNVYRGDPGCEYAGGESSDGTTGCLLGQALLALGFTARALRKLDEQSVSSINVALKTLLGTDNLPPNKVRWLRRVQDAQDIEVAWGQAVLAANQEVPL
jgi:hypothetical protein